MALTASAVLTAAVRFCSKELNAPSPPRVVFNQYSTGALEIPAQSSALLQCALKKRVKLRQLSLKKCVSF